MAKKVKCEDCIHEEVCSNVRKNYGIITYVYGFVDCGQFVPKEGKEWQPLKQE